ncbi:hypothetical protein FFB58_13805 [Enterobacter sp. MF024]|nr:hypothetical protein FFB58_13805 [Enterobacter sp. MF024]
MIQNPVSPPAQRLISRWLWISLCVNRYKAGFCWGMQQSVIFLSFKGCGLKRTPYNAPPSTRQM